MTPCSQGDQELLPSWEGVGSDRVGTEVSRRAPLSTHCQGIAGQPPGIQWAPARLLVICSWVPSSSPHLGGRNEVDVQGRSSGSHQEVPKWQLGQPGQGMWHQGAARSPGQGPGAVCGQGQCDQLSAGQTSVAGLVLNLGLPPTPVLL